MKDTHVMFISATCPPTLSPIGEEFTHCQSNFTFHQGDILYANCREYEAKMNDALRDLYKINPDARIQSLHVSKLL